MDSKAPPPSAPAGVPPSGGGKFVVLAIVLVALIGGLVFWKTRQEPPTPEVVYVDAGPPPATNIVNGRNLDEEVPLPPPEEDAGADAGKKVATGPAYNPCDVKKCSGSATPELEQALGFRVKQAHRCYDNALSQDPTLKGKLTVNVRIASNGQVCSASVTNNELGSQQVASCVAGYFRGATFPTPKGGCIDANIPANFVPRQ